MTDLEPLKAARDPQAFIPGYRIRYVELDTVCEWLVDNGWAGLLSFDEAVKAMGKPTSPALIAEVEALREAPIDVERLARALHNAYCRDNRPMHSDEHHSANAIAREYALGASDD